MAGLSFAFAGNRPARLHFSWPSVRSPTGQQCNPRYRWIPAPSPILPRQVGGRFVVPLPPFPGFLPPQNVRAGGAGGAWRPASLQAAALATPWGQASQATAVLHPAFRAAARQPATLGSAWRDTPLSAVQGRVPWRAATARAVRIGGAWDYALTMRQALDPVWRESTPVGVDLALHFLRAWRCWRNPSFAWKAGRAAGISIGPGWRSAWPVGPAIRIPWQGARPLGGLSWPWPPLPPWIPPPIRHPLRFHFHGPVWPRLHFAFGREPAWVIPIRRSYRMLHEIEIVRLPDRAVLPARGLTLNSAWDEWSWSVALQLLPPALELLRPIVYEAVTIEATINGYTWQFRLDQVSGSAQFAQISGQTQGRSRAALLGPDVALPANGYETHAKTARQLAEQELTGTNWQLDWPEDFPDWLVPARTLSYTQKTPIEVISQIVATAGWRILADPALDWIQVRPRYPVPVWDWWDTEPDILLPRAILTTLAWKPRLGQPWDAVYLGDGATVLAKVKRTGLPGVSLPDSPTIEPLLCHLDACRARGIAILSDAAAGVDFTLTLPLSAADGPSPLRAVGELARFEEGGVYWIGLITAVSIQVGFGTVAQTLEVRAVEMPT